MEEIKIEEDTIPTLFKKYREGSIEARDKIIEHYMPRAEQIAAYFYGLGLEKEDVIASAYEGLITAVTSYKDLTSTNFVSYMIYVVTSTVEKAIIESYSSTLKSTKNKYIKVLLAIKEFKNIFHRNPTLVEISEYTKLNINVVDSLLSEIKQTRHTSLNSMTLEESNEVINGVLDIETRLIKKGLLDYILSLLTERKQIVIKMIYLEQNPPTREEIGKIIKRSPARVQTIRAEAICKIKRFYKYIYENFNFDEERAAVSDEIAARKVKK